MNHDLLPPCRNVAIYTIYVSPNGNWLDCELQKLTKMFNVRFQNTEFFLMLSPTDTRLYEMYHELRPSLLLCI